MTKLTVNRPAHALDDLASHMDVDQFALASMSEDHKEGVEAFLGRRKPRFRGNSSNGSNCANAKLTKLLKLNLNSHPISGG